MAKVFFRRLFKFILIVAFIASIFVYPKWYEKQWHKVQGMYWVAQGDKYLRKTNFQKAIDLYKRGLELYPEHYGAWFNLGNLYVAYEDYYSAIDAYSNAIKHNPNYVIARMNYGIISAEKLGDFDGAIAQYDKIIGIRRKLVYIPFVFNNLKSYKTNIGLAYYNKGVAYRQKSTYLDNKYTEKQAYLLQAIKSYEEAVKILKNDYDARYNLALAYHLNGDFNLAGLTYCKAIKLAPLNYEAHYNLAVLLSHLKYYKEALKELQKANSIVRGEEGDTNQTRYVFDIMNDVTRKILKDDEGRKYMSEEFSKETEDSMKHVKYVNGKVVSSEELDSAMYKDMQNCAGRSIFRNEDNLDEEGNSLEETDNN
ncbi:MAG: tetratricopeptide repeat protein [Candidatus Gastranaerophilaceae bacterium]|nr:tetratricopeptide repeat protein [Candidatus Gastranaerophilaceae bacterium]